MHEYDVALSFAGADRPFAEEVARLLKARGARVFYYPDPPLGWMTINLVERLEKVYGKESRFCLVFISLHYSSTPWTRDELMFIQNRLHREGPEFLLPVRLDATEIPGIPVILEYFSGDPLTVADLVFAKVSGKDSDGGLLDLARRASEVLGIEFVVIPRARFALAETLVTVTQWDKIMGNPVEQDGQELWEHKSEITSADVERFLCRANKRLAAAEISEVELKIPTVEQWETAQKAAGEGKAWRNEIHPTLRTLESKSPRLPLFDLVGVAHQLCGSLGPHDRITAPWELVGFGRRVPLVNPNDSTQSWGLRPLLHAKEGPP